jgi:hypothetical protein
MHAPQPDVASVEEGFNVLSVLADLGLGPGLICDIGTKPTQERDKIKRWVRAMVKACCT